jgi:hypothetical protein
LLLIERTHFQAEAAKKAAETAFEECSDAARHEVSPDQFCFLVSSYFWLPIFAFTFPTFVVFGSFSCDSIKRFDGVWPCRMGISGLRVGRNPDGSTFFYFVFPSLSRAQPNKFAIDWVDMLTLTGRL